MFPRYRTFFLGLALTFAPVAALPAPPAPGVDPFAHVPAVAPRTLVLAGRADDFRAYVSTGPGRVALENLRADFDAQYIDLPFPEEPRTYGDPEPRTRTSAKADKWRADQDTCGLVSGVAEAGSILWLATGEQRYLAKAKEFLLKSTDWSLDPSGWPDGPALGATDVFYNDEAHFRLWRKLPLVYDLIRSEFTAAERAKILAHFQERGERSLRFIRRGRVEQAERNSLVGRPSSHPIRFMAMTGLTALALWDDLPEQTRDWWELSYTFYRDRFPSWGGDDGGWAEGVAYWRGTMEHAAFQDALVAIGDPLAYNTAFWRNTAYFQVYTVQPFRHTAFGDLSNAGKFDIEPRSAEFLHHLARVLRDGRIATYANLARVQESPAEGGLKGVNRIYPTSVEFLLRNFTVSHLAPPAPAPLSELPPHRHFADIGWVAMHSALGRPDDNIHVAFKSSPYGSFSHSHADQNAFILNAYGENLAINSGYREFHRSPHHSGWTWQTKSKNALLIDGLGQKSQDITSTGRILKFDTGPRHAWTVGDATEAYATLQPAGRVKSVLRDLVFIDQRYVVIRDRVELAAPGKLTWLLHAERPIEWRAADSLALIRGAKATLTTRLVTPAGVKWNARVQSAFDVPVDPKYADGGVSGFGETGKWTEQSHLFAETAEPRASHLVFAVLWPERDGLPARPLEARLAPDGRLQIKRPDGRTDVLRLTETSLSLD